MQNYDLKQGDAYELPVRIFQDGVDIGLGDVEKIEFMIGRHLRRLYPGDVTVEETEESGRVFNVPVGQAETMEIRSGQILRLDVRVKFNSGMVLGATEKPVISIGESYSGEVL